jgi:hypothetical protein
MEAKLALSLITSVGCSGISSILMSGFIWSISSSAWIVWHDEQLSMPVFIGSNPGLAVLGARS